MASCEVEPGATKVHQTRSQEHVGFIQTSVDLLQMSKQGALASAAAPGARGRRSKTSQKVVGRRLKKTSRSIYGENLTEHLFPALVVVIYTIIGAIIFQAIEYEDDLAEKKQLVAELKDAKQQVILQYSESPKTEVCPT